MEFKIIKIGNSIGIRLGYKLLSNYNLKVNDKIVITINNNVITNTNVITNKDVDVITFNKSSELAHNKEYYQSKLQEAKHRNDLDMIKHYENKLNDC